MPLKPQRIAIIGAGTAGLSAATLLARQGHAITLMEQAPALTPVGAGLLLQPPGLDVLEVLGARAPLEALGARVDSLVGTTRRGRQIMDVHYATLDRALYGLGVHRASLCHVLLEALQREPHTMWLNTAVHDLTQQAGKVLIRFRRDGAEAQAVFDAALIANGAASQLRPPELVKYDRQYPWGALWAMLPATEAAPANELRQRYYGSHTMAGLLPTGNTPQQPGQPLQSFFWSLQVADIKHWQAGNIDFPAWQAQLAELWPEAEGDLQQITTPEQLIPATYRDVILKRFALGRVGLIGDAAHAMSPQLGQGATMALLDAQALAVAMAAEKNWDDVWAHYHQARKDHLRFYQAMSRLLTPIFQSRMPGAGVMRDIGFPFMNNAVWFPKKIIRTVAGYGL